MISRTRIAVVVALVVGAMGCDRQGPTGPGGEAAASGSPEAPSLVSQQVDPMTLVQGGFRCTDRSTITFDGELEAESGFEIVNELLELSGEEEGSAGAAFAERFAGQTLERGSNFDGGEGDEFDVLTGAPDPGLTLETGNPGQNLAVSETTPGGPVVVAGLGVAPTIFLRSSSGSSPASDGSSSLLSREEEPAPGVAFGEGSVAVRFRTPQAGVEVVTGGVDAPEGTATFQFFRSDGSLIHTVVLDELEPAPQGDPGLQTWVFRRGGDVSDVAGFSVHNDDPGGIFYDDVVLCGSFQRLVIEVSIDIKPGSDPNSINTNSNGVVPVAILGTEDFDVTRVDATTLRFDGPDGAEPAHDMGDPEIFRGHLEDVNDDGLTDLVTHYRQKQTGLEPDAEEGCISGELTDGTELEGCDSVRMLDRGGGPPDEAGPDDEDRGPDNAKRKARKNRRK